MTVVEQQPSGLERIWRRRSLWALLLIVPLSLFTISYSDLDEFSRYNDLLPVDVAAGETKHYGGSDWQFTGLRKVEGLKSRLIPKDAVPLLARFQVEIGNSDLQNLWLMCAIKLVDHAGRSWYPVNIPGLSSQDQSVATCSSTVFSGVQKGARVVIEESFLVPANVADEVLPTLGVFSERPYYLRFAKP